MPSRFDPFDEEEAPPARPCDHPGCPEPGEFRAPKSRHNLREYYYFCMEHVRDYNKKWNYFDGFTQDQIYSQMRHDLVGERPTWPPHIAITLETRLHDFLRRWTKENGSDATLPKRVVSKEAQAYETLGLAPIAEQKAVKARYRELVKRYHPDKNPDNPKAVERFKIVSEAYMIIQATWSGKR